MSTSTLGPTYDEAESEGRKSTVQVVLPTAGGLPDRTAIRGRRPEESARKRSRVHRPHGPSTVFGFSGGSAPYRWVDPFTWQDTALYGEGQLRQQFVTNLQEVPRLLGVLQEDMVDSDSDVDPDGSFYKPVFPELTVPMGVNEIWYFLEVIRYSGAGAPGTDQLRFGWYTPLGAFMEGTAPTIDGSGNAFIHDISLNNTLETQQEWENGIAFPEHQNGTQRLVYMDFFVTTGATAGNLECGITSISTQAVTVYAGTCLFGMRLTP